LAKVHEAFEQNGAAEIAFTPMNEIDEPEC
jgi:hypothetical protein